MFQVLGFQKGFTNCFHIEKRCNGFMGPVDRATTVVHRSIVHRAVTRWPSSSELVRAGAMGHDSSSRELLEEGGGEPHRGDG
jgi:hypothetical protein